MSSPTLPKLPSRTQSSVRSLKNLSTRFIQEDDLGVKCHVDALHSLRLPMALIMPFNPGTHFCVFVGAIVVDDQMQGETFGVFLVELFKKTQPLPMSVASRRLMEDFAVEIVQGGAFFKFPDDLQGLLLPGGGGVW
ncbi:hypothetical protein V2O64_23025 [Verrucomicrobiaceae bacterium 227]